MHKFIYFSKKKNQIMTVYFSNLVDLMGYMADNYDDIDFEDHFVKVVKE